MDLTEQDEELFLRLINPRSTDEDVLCVTSSSTDEEIARAYRELSRRVHPDRLDDVQIEALESANIKKESLMIRVRRAYEGLRRVDLFDCRVKKWIWHAETWSQWTAPYQLQYMNTAEHQGARAVGQKRLLEWSTLRHDLVVLSFWNHKCPPCIMYSCPMLNVMHTQLNIPVIGVVYPLDDQEEDDIELQEHPMHYPTCQLERDDIDKLANSLDIKSIPKCCIVHKGRSVWCGHSGEVINALKKFGMNITDEDIKKVEKESFHSFVEQMFEAAEQRYVVSRDYVNRAVNSYMAGYFTHDQFKDILNNYENMPSYLYYQVSFHIRPKNSKLAEELAQIYIKKEREANVEMVERIHELLYDDPIETTMCGRCKEVSLYCCLVCCTKFLNITVHPRHWCNKHCSSCQPNPMNYTDEFMILDGQRMV